MGVAREAKTAGWPPAGSGSPGPDGSTALRRGAPGCPRRAPLLRGGPGSGGRAVGEGAGSAGLDAHGVFSPAAWIS